MKKISRDNIIKSTLMFWVDESIEQKYIDIYNKDLPKYNSMANITDRELLKKFLKENKESVKLLMTVLGISGEKFKRIITFLRISKGFIVTSEWSESKVHSELCTNPTFLEELCDLFLNQEVYKGVIPASILDDFRLDYERVSRVCSRDMLIKLIKNSYTTAYNSECSTAYASAIINSIRNYTDKYGLQFSKLINRDINPKEELLSISNEEKSIIITLNYTVTTSNNQTVYAKGIQDLRSAICSKRQYILVNILDGVGWVARSSDFNKIYNDCNYFLNMANIDDIETIIKEHFNIQ